RDNMNVGFTFSAKSGRQDGNRSLDGYQTLDLRAGYRCSDKLSVNLALTNILDEDYELAYGYNSPRSQAMLSATFVF
ncbi:MAG: TonB-dependent receptor, partial [Pseudomonadales bacterium]|nr:TonB-dependent receptor [Pseudomonadales bacterium]